MKNSVKIQEVLNNKKRITSYDKVMYKTVKKNWDLIAKPLDSMGAFEEIHSRIGAILASEHPVLDKSRILVFCADNGIVEEGISQSDQSLTAICADTISRGKSCLGALVEASDTDILTIDVGINTDKSFPHVRNCKIKKGTNNFLKEPAMTEEEVLKAIELGMDLVYESKNDGYTLIGIGEMGIGNTTTSSAVAAALLDCPVDKLTGRGAGLSDEGLRRKIEVITIALEKYDLKNVSVLKVLSSVGGLDIASMVGVCIGGALYNIPIVLDGFISMVAALVASRLIPTVKDFLIPSHCSKEPGATLIKNELELNPVIDARMALGEGTGAALMISLLKTVSKIYDNSNSFFNSNIEPYQRF